MASHSFSSIEAELRASESLYKRLFETAQDGILILDAATGQVVDANLFMRTLLGYSPEEFVGRKLWEIGPFRSIEDSKTAFAELQVEDNIRYESLSLERKDGRRVETEFIGSAYTADGRRLIQCNIRDITERRRLEKIAGEKISELARSNAELLSKTAFFEAQVNSALDGILVVDPEGRKILQNQRLVDLWQIPSRLADDCDDRWQLEWVTRQTKNPDQFADRIAHLAAHPYEISHDEIELKNGRILDRYSAPVRSDSGHSYGRIWTFRDVTEERGRERELATALTRETELAREAQAGNRAKSEFLAAMSHEIRTPMNAILGFAEILSQTPDLPANCLDSVQTISSSAEVLLRILNDILDHSHLEASALKILKDSFSPRDVLLEVRRLLAPQASAKLLDFEIIVDDDVPEMLWNDAGRFRQLLVNLANNAIKFTEQGSVVLGLQVAGKTPNGDPLGIELFVRDTGPGIPPEKLGDIFNPFIQLDAHTSRRYGGTGLGLSISLNLAELMGGTLIVLSEEGTGSEFRVNLPVLAPDGPLPLVVELPEDALDESFSRRYPLRLLLAEDDPTNRKLMIQVLRNLGYEPVIAANGIEAVEAYRRQQSECILMDLQMPRKDGLEATLEIREIERTTGPRKRVFISALTANIVAEDQQRCFNVGMDAYMNKPIKRTLLAKTLMQASNQVSRNIPAIQPRPGVG